MAEPHPPLLLPALFWLRVRAPLAMGEPISMAVAEALVCLRARTCASTSCALVHCNACTSVAKAFNCKLQGLSTHFTGKHTNPHTHTPLHM